MPSDLSSESTEDLELQALRLTHNGHAAQNGASHQNGYDSDDSDDLSAGFDEGDRALLSPNSGARESASRRSATLWERIKDIILEAAPTLLLTTISLSFTGELLDKVSRWRAMQQVDQLIMIIPVVLNLKGNLEMNLAARLGTAANVGELDEPKTRRQMILGNLSLLQAQAAVVSFIAACMAFLLGFLIPHLPPPEGASTPARRATKWLTGRKPIPKIPSGTRKSGLPQFVLVCATSMSAACLSSLILGSFMCFLIVLCRILGRNPDNIAPPIASCLGDLVTLVLIGLVSMLLIDFLRTPIPLLLGCLVIAFATFCTVYVRKNSHVRDLIFEGWVPLFGAMIISSGTGIILDLFVSRYEGFALLAVVISGLPGAVGSIFVSRLSTSLHAAALSTGSKPLPGAKEASPRLVMITLMIVTLPVEVIFLSILRALGWLRMPFTFVAFSVLFFCVAVAASLFIARLLTNFLWSRDKDPDMYALPIHSALMDLIGQLLLVLCFEIVSLLGVPVSYKRRGIIP